MRILCFLSHSITFLVSKIRNGIGSILPTKPTAKASHGSSPRATPTGIAPRISSTGSIAVTNVFSILFSVYFIRILPLPHGNSD